MPLLGTREVAPLLEGTAVMDGYGTEPLELKGVSILNLVFEIRQEAMVSLLPPSLHPTIPPTVVVTVTNAPESPFGAFTLAEVRAGCRAGARPRGFLTRCYTDSAEAAGELARRWGYPAHSAAVSLKKGYDRVTASVVLDGRDILSCEVINPEPIGGGDVQYLPNVNMARVQTSDGIIPKIVQVDPDFAIAKADRGKPALLAFDPGAWLLDGADPWWPVSGSYVTADMTLPHLRYILDPVTPAVQGGVEKVG
jgi:hypothetical protein